VPSRPWSPLVVANESTGAKAMADREGRIISTRNAECGLQKSGCLYSGLIYYLLPVRCVLAAYLLLFAGIRCYSLVF